jgi:hypothetical protein
MWWVHEHMHELEAHQGNWIAVIDQRIIASNQSLDAVMDEVERQGLTEPFVVKIPADVHRKTYFIG